MFDCNVDLLQMKQCLQIECVVFKIVADEQYNLQILFYAKSLGHLINLVISRITK